MHLIFRLSQWWYLHTIFQTQGGVWGDSAGPTLAILNFLKKKVAIFDKLPAWGWGDWYLLGGALRDVA